MYVPKAFQTDHADAIQFLQERAFGVLVIEGRDGPTGVQVPFLTLEHDDGSVSLELHVARANLIHALIGEVCSALVMCQGPDAYITGLAWRGRPGADLGLSCRAFTWPCPCSARYRGSWYGGSPFGAIRSTLCAQEVVDQ